MELVFLWEEIAGKPIPCCYSQDLNVDGINFLACLLMDDGGQDYIRALPWIGEGVALVDMVVNGGIASASWDREAWGAKIGIDGVEIYSLHDDEFSERMGVLEFQSALAAWELFLKSAPDFRGGKKIYI